MLFYMYYDVCMIKQYLHIFQLSHSGTKYSLYFLDEIRSVDFVLVWDEYDGEAQTYDSVEHRRVSLTNYYINNTHIHIYRFRYL